MIGVSLWKDTRLLLPLAYILSRSATWWLNEHVSLLPDSRLYLDVAYAIKQGGTIQSYMGNDSILIAPLYPYFLWLLDQAQAGFQGLVVVQSFFGFLCGLLLYRIAVRQIGTGPALGVTFFYWFSPAILFYEHTVMTEMLFSLLFLLSLDVFLRLLEPNTPLTLRSLLLCGLLFGLLLATKPLGKIVILLFVFSWGIIKGRVTLSAISRRARLALLGVVILCVMVWVLKPRKESVTPGGGLPSLVAMSFAPMLDLTFPPIEADPDLKARVIPGIDFAQSRSDVLWGYHIPPNNSGYESVNYNYHAKAGLINAIRFAPELIPDPDRFFSEWVLYSIKRKPLGLVLFIGKQIYNAVVMLSGAFLDHAPDFYTGLLMPLSHPLLQGPIDPILERRTQSQRTLNPAFERYYQRHFEVISFKRVIMFMYRGLFILACLMFAYRWSRTIFQRSQSEFLSRESFSAAIFTFFFGYAVFLSITSVPLGRYFVMLFPICLIYLIKEGQNLISLFYVKKTAKTH